MVSMPKVQRFVPLSFSGSSITAARDPWESYMNYMLSTNDTGYLIFYQGVIGMQIIPISAAADSALSMLHPLPVPVTKGRVKLIPRTRHDYSNKSNHVNVRKML